MPEKTPSYKIKQKPRKSKKKQGLIQIEATNIQSSPETETRKFTIGYEYYRSDLCEVDYMVQGPLRKSIDYFKSIGLCTTPLEIKNIGGFHVKPVNDSQTYSQYYSGLRDEDVEIKELVAAGSARHFFFIDPSKKIVQIVAHVNTHTPLGKQVK